MNSNKMYYYTDYNTFNLILRNGTLRFKESTSSNDRLDTLQLYNELSKMAEEKLKEADLRAEQKFYFDMLKRNEVKSSRISLVNRKDRKAERYNGVCLEFDRQLLVNTMNNSAKIFDIKECKNITYGYEGIRDYLEQIIDDFSTEVERLSKDKDQRQNIIQPISIPVIHKALVLKKCIVLIIPFASLKAQTSYEKCCAPPLFDL